jgi:hypothetical protein
MKNIFLLIIIIQTLAACNNDANKPIEKENTPGTTIKKLSVEEQAKGHIMRALSIPANEKFTYTIYKEYLDGDDKIDAIITLNRFENAKNDAAKSPNPALYNKFGHMGYYNFIFYYDGELNLISPQIVIASNASVPLKVSFENVYSLAYKDAIVEYHVSNAGYREYFTIVNHTPKSYFKWKNFDGVLKGTQEAFTFGYTDGTMGPLKDILIYKAQFKQPAPGTDPNTFEPKLNPTKEIAYRFFYHTETDKYMTKNK